jgi:cytochrome c-type biogenesis protein CcmH/NrfG
VPPDRGFHKSRAERYKNEGNDALAKGEAGRATDLYGVAIRLDPGNAVYHANKSMASYCLGRYRDSANQTCVAILNDGKYAKVWSRYGYAEVKQGRNKSVIQAYTTAIELAGGNATNAMR